MKNEKEAGAFFGQIIFWCRLKVSNQNRYLGRTMRPATSVILAASALE
jgi:hypothetical protein